MSEYAPYLMKAFAVAKRSMDKGNLAFGCILAGPDGEILLEGENTVIIDNDSIAHCEINLVHRLAGKFEPAFLQQCTVYATTEPCPMCSAAIFWSGIGKIVFALSKEGYHKMAATNNPAHVLNIKAEEILQKGGRPVIVVGPVMEEEAKSIYAAWLA